MWDLISACELIRLLRPGVMNCGYDIALAGGVLNAGHSDKDLDLVAVPMARSSSKAQLALFLNSSFLVAKIHNIHNGEVYELQHGVKSIDFIVLNH